MKISIISIGHKLSGWANQAVADYIKRIPPEYGVTLTEIPAVKRKKSTNMQNIINRESEQLVRAVPKHSRIIICDRSGSQVSTEQLAEKLRHFNQDGQPLSFLIGGPEGIASSYFTQVDWLWSLSKLTLPHPLARVVVVEQIYRAWSILSQHPYHR